MDTVQFGRLYSIAAPVQLLAADANAGKRRRFRITGYTGEPMRIAGFGLPVVIEVASVDISWQRIPALYNHDPTPLSVVGQTDRIEVERGALVFYGAVCPTDLPGDMARTVLERAAAGFQWQASVGGNPATVEEYHRGETLRANGRSYEGPLYFARNLDLREISFVVLGGDRNTSATLTAKGAAAAVAAASKPCNPVESHRPTTEDLAFDRQFNLGIGGSYFTWDGKRVWAGEGAARLGYAETKL